MLCPGKEECDLQCPEEGECLLSGAMQDPETGVRGLSFKRLRISAGLAARRPSSYELEETKRSEESEYYEKKQKLFKYARDKNLRDSKTATSNLRTLKNDFKSIPETRDKLFKDTDERGNTALHYAAKAGNLEICQLLYNEGQGADVNARGQYEMNPLQFAARYGDEKRPGDVWACMDWIINVYKASKKTSRDSVRSSRGRVLRTKKEKDTIQFDIHEKDKYDFTILHHAIQNTNWEENPIVVEKLLESREFKITEADKQGNTSLHLAAQFDKQEGHRILDIFLDNENIPEEDLKSCIKHKNLLGKTPLHVSCGVGNPESVVQLLTKGKELKIDVKEIINSSDNDGYHPLNLAIESGNLEMMNTLIEEGVPVTEDAINTAARTGDVGLLQKLTEAAGTSTDTVDTGIASVRNILSTKKADKRRNLSGCSALYVAAQHNNKETVEYLLNQRSDVTSNAEGITPLMIALKEGNTEIAKLLLSTTSLTETDNEDQNVFHYAFFSKKPKEVTKLLVEFCLEHFDTNKLKDFLTAKDLNENTPLHSLAQQQLDRSEFGKIFEHLRNADILECMKEGNATKQTPLHKAARYEQTSFVEAVLDIDKDSKSNQLLSERDENSNTALHLATQDRRTETAKIFLEHLRKDSKEPLKYLTMKNIFGWTPFSGAVSSGDIETVKEMLKGLSWIDRKALVNQPDFSNACPLHLAAKHGHVEVFSLLLENTAEITRRGPDQKTALDLAIDKEQRAVITFIINGPTWKEAFDIPSLSDRGDLDTPLRKLIKQLPDLAEEFLDKCYEIKVQSNEEGKQTSDEQEVIKMNYDFIEDTYKYNIVKCENKNIKNEFRNRKEAAVKNLPSEYNEKKYVVDMANHPMVIMADSKKLDLLQHPLCLAIIIRKWTRYRMYYFFQLAYYLLFLIFLSFYILTSVSPIAYPELCGSSNYSLQQIRNISINATRLDYKKNEFGNDFCRFAVLILFGIRIFMFFVIQEFKPMINNMKKASLKQPKTVIKSLDFVFLADALVYVLSFYTAIHNFSYISVGDEHIKLDVRSCAEWQISAITITLAWLNLLLYMRLLYGLGKYILLLQDVLVTFFVVVIVFFILLIAFAFGFHILLSNKDVFEHPWDSMLKTLVMSVGEYEFEELFFQDVPPQGFGEDWDLGHLSVPFKPVTYTMFVIFFLMISLVAINVLVGLTVDDIRNFLENADLRKLTMRLKYILAMERHYFIKRNEYQALDPVINKRSNFEMSVTNDLISKEKIWKKIEIKQEDQRRKAEVEQEKKDMKEHINDQTKRVLKDVSMLRKKVSKKEKESEKRNSRGKFNQSGQSSFDSKFEYDDDKEHSERIQTFEMIMSHIKNQDQVKLEMQEFKERFLS